MRIIASFIVGFLVFFYLSEYITRLLKKSPTIRNKLSFNHSILGVFLVLASAASSFFTKNDSLYILLSFFVFGSGTGLITHHLLSKGYILFKKPEQDFISRHEKGIERLMEILPGGLTWIALLSPLWLSFIFPFAVAYLVIIADIYWLLNSLKIAALIYIGYKRMEKAKSINWLKQLKEEYPKRWEEYYHLIVLPTFKEPVEVLKPAFDAVINSSYPKKKIFLAVGFEERDDQQRVTESIAYLKTIAPQIGGIFTTVHPFRLPGEVPGPGSNRNWMVNNADKEFRKLNIPSEKVFVTTLDADFVLHPQFLAGSLHKYLSTPEEIRDKRTYTGVFLYYNNYWQTPTPMRLIAAGTAFWQLAEMVGSDKYMNFSSMSINLKSLLDIGLWIPNKVNDDAGFFWKAYFHFEGDYKVIPHFMPINADAVSDVSFVKTIQNQYGQQKRWVYGAEHIPFVIRQYFKHKDINFFDKTDKLIFALWGYVRWGMLALFVTFAGMLIPLVNPHYSTSVVAYNLPIISSWFLTAAFLGMFATVFVHEKTVPKRPARWSLIKKIWSYIQWVMVPLIIVTISTIPAIDALTSLMLGRYMEFRVTNKVRT